MTPTVFIIDDEPYILNWLRTLIQSINIRAETYANAEEFLSGYSQDFPGCLVLDIRMQGMSGLELHELLIERNNTIPTIFLSGHGDIAMAVQAMRNGAFDFLEKPVRDQHILDRIQAALGADRQRRQEAGRRVAIRQRIDQMTDKEHQVLERILDGKLNKIIADELQVSEKTVEYRRARLMKKLDVKTVAELAQMVHSLRVSERAKR